MQINYLIFSVFSALLLGLNSPVYAITTESNECVANTKSKSENRFRRFLDGLNKVELKLPRISRKNVISEYTVEDLVSKLREVEKTRSNTKNPFKKIRCLIQESNIKKKINSLLKEKNEEEKFEKFEEEFPMDYSPKVLSEEGSISPYIPVVVEDYKDVEVASGTPIRNDEEMQDEIKYLTSEDADQSVSGELDDLADPITSETGNENEGTEDSVTEDFEKKVLEDNLEDYQTKDMDGESQSNENEQQTDLDLQENADKEEKGNIQNKGRLRNIFKRKKLTASEKLERLMSLKKNIESRISSSKSKLLRRILGMKLKRVNNKISKITDAAVDTVTESGEIDIE
ncbi:unnamed protein product [Cryptosporidium hominis]|uniref:Uncharacterized protein n=1 Tax=Cryptosporidium hominis TaxID=237895 RepID=A0A0S4TDN9_CRYHO|nr:hypothetical protein [Cryptosporidium hominis TU502]OLQ16160.1 hypothetical protein ChTU502y2012_366g0170 [Cryptosporidium hominis]PPA63450.1 hypothetical protein ChUKH1_07915 [Cryptosporidium hominis]PPS95125.1 Uncharacterized protein GY17_00002207 [Cryptosporidium hominis]CUV04610.1 unnamed protein product [Cryptosporidium hominis]|eukprot:PPS95125.1 Uncharacterized protein GY17_00002207 [Cryptosporidium hominis]